MIEILIEYGLFLAKAVTIVVAILFVIGGIASVGVRNRKSEHGHIEVDHINEQFEDLSDTLKHAIFDEAEVKEDKKLKKKREKAKAKEKKSQKEGEHKKRIFVLDFDGDVEASSVGKLTEEINAVLTIATEKDEVLVAVESPGGMVHTYGLAASQLHRIKEHNIPLTISVDRIAASGGYLMACIADQIIAAPFAILGSIGVMAEVPNFHRLLKKHEVDFEVLTAGEHKRTLTTFGQNTEKGRAKFVEELEDTHELFKGYIAENRPQIDIEAVATGEYWYGTRAIELKLVDALDTKDEYLLKNLEDAELYSVNYLEKKTLQEKIGLMAQHAVSKALLSFSDRMQRSRFYR